MVAYLVNMAYPHGSEHVMIGFEMASTSAYGPDKSKADPNPKLKNSLGCV